MLFHYYYNQHQHSATCLKKIKVKTTGDVKQLTSIYIIFKCLWSAKKQAPGAPQLFAFFFWQRAGELCDFVLTHAYKLLACSQLLRNQGSRGGAKNYFALGKKKQKHYHGNVKKKLAEATTVPYV